MGETPAPDDTPIFDELRELLGSPNIETSEDIDTPGGPDGAYSREVPQDERVTAIVNGHAGLSDVLDVGSGPANTN